MAESKEKKYMVLMHFGDGSYHRIEIEAESPEEAIEQARQWVDDNSFYEVDDTYDG